MLSWVTCLKGIYHAFLGYSIFNKEYTQFLRMKGLPQKKSNTRKHLLKAKTKGQKTYVIFTSIYT